MITINALNAGGRDPAALVRAALKKGAQELEVLTDGTTSAMKVKQLLEEEGFHVQIEDDDGRLKLTAARETLPPRPPQPVLVPMAQPRAPAQKNAPAPRALQPVQAQPGRPAPREGARLTVLITGETLGRGNNELGGILIRNFLRELAELATPPRAVALMNGGVRLALFDSSACDYLKDLERAGTKVLVSGICAAHFGITESVGAGILASMSDVVGELSKAENTVTL